MIGKVKQFLKNHTNYGKSRYLNFLFRYDMDRYFAFSSMNRGRDKARLETEIRLLVHSIEKALSLPAVRPGFGREKIQDLLKNYELYCELGEQTNFLEIDRLVRGAIHAYVAFQKEFCKEFDFSFIPVDMIECNTEECVGIDIESGRDFSALSFDDFARSRHSIRYFGTASVNEEMIRKSVALAQTAPSACNRQSPHVYATTNTAIIGEIMSFHGGVRGFGRPQVIIAVAGSLQSYVSEYERNTVYVDGGIFVMNLLYSLHYYGLATCPVIWGTEPDNDGKLRQLLDIPESHTIISLVMVGSYPEEPCKFAKSIRKDTEDILHLKK